jgi:thiosulfate/3-mercaptopyruvate sulfurtransferase
MFLKHTYNTQEYGTKGDFMRIRNNLLAAALMILLLTAAGCSGDYAETGTIIVDAKEAVKLIASGDVVLVDAQSSSAYEKEHMTGAVNIARADIVKSDPVVNVLADQAVIEEAFGSRGISNDSAVLIYDDNNNMDAARLWWTMLVYGHDQVKVVSGGLNALTAAGLTVTTAVPAVTPAVFKASAKDTSLIATVDEVLSQVNDPADGVCFIDTRTTEEFEAGTIPTSIHLDYAGNNYGDGTFRKVQDIQIRYKEAGINPEDTAIMYCKTSIRGAQTFLALYNAGYRNLKLYDGAWVEWIKDANRPIQMPEALPVRSNMQDNS